MKIKDVEKANILMEKINQIGKVISNSGYKQWSEEGFEMQICDNGGTPVKLSENAPRQ